MKALLLIDLQIDFLPGGALGVDEGDQIIPIANQLMPHFPLVVATQDWHPADHVSFAANHPWRYPGQLIELEDGTPQVLWPIHCVQHSFGAELAPNLQREGIHKIIYKGTDKNIDSYSGFYDNQHRKATGMLDYLQAQGVEEVFVMGLATDYCVKASAIDAVGSGLRCHLIADGCRAVNLQEGDAQKAIEEMKAAGVQLTHSHSLLPTSA
ncbi:MAG: bifunctional nicotinamidase/pyrazinamidase [Bacteroidota bacterium]